MLCLPPEQQPSMVAIALVPLPPPPPKKKLCQPQSVFFPILKVSPQLLIKGISSLKQIWAYFRINTMITSLFVTHCTLFSIPFSWVNALITVPRACKRAHPPNGKRKESAMSNN